MWSAWPLVLGLTLPATPGADLSDLRTLAEQSGFVRTGRYDEVLSLCERFAQRFDKQVRCETFGTTPQGRRMVALVASADGTFSPQDIAKKNRPVVLAQGCIHAGEVDGKDAGLGLLRNMLSGEILPGVLSKLTFVLVPVFNVDGHERFAAHQRPNQRGPVETGWRVGAHNLNLNRDYAKAETPEMKAMLGLLKSFDPLLYVDLHVTDGADFQPDVAVQIEPRLGGPNALRAAGNELSQKVLDELRRGGHRPLDFYPNFVKKDDPSSGFVQEVPPPRFSTGYWPLRNRFAALVETHSYKPYDRRVKTTLDTLTALLRHVGERGKDFLTMAHEADRADASRPTGSKIVLSYATGPFRQEISFPGYAYKLEPSWISGGLKVSYDPQKPMVWKIPFFPTVVEKTLVRLPAGYVIPKEHAGWMADKLGMHGLSFSQVPNGFSGPCSVFRARQRVFADGPYEGRQTVKVEGEWHTEPCEAVPGSLFVPTGQRGQTLLTHLLEPDASDSFLHWGFFNAVFEQKEYLEDYIAEQVAVQLLAQDAALQKEFALRLQNPAFAANPSARLQFFAERHPSFDRFFNRYPILRMDKPLPNPKAKPVAQTLERFGQLLPSR
ncbi:MAG TPA: M14 family zinc carboxypeptidase [Pseudomonadota bacterium]|nr:M14 family zinc carboxypeptidase [Pseudomonadota bacterium]